MPPGFDVHHTTRVDASALTGVLAQLEQRPGT
jgi:hypothetical protein